MKKILLLTLSFLSLSACERGQGISLHPYKDYDATPYSFSVCHGFSCSYKTPVTLTEQDWQDILAPFAVRAENAAQEREQIAQSIGIMETKVQKIGQLNPDLGEATTFENDQDQMDCIDEAINTSHYLQYIESFDVLKFNEIANPIHRGYFVDAMWPHNSAAVREIETEERFAVDSYYFDNGTPASIVPIDVWLDRWNPKKSQPQDRS